MLAEKTPHPPAAFTLSPSPSVNTGEEPEVRRAPLAIATAWRQPFGAANHALAEWLGHLIAVAVLLSGFHAIEALLTRVGLHNRSMTVGSLFDAGDTGLIIGFLVFGVISVLRAYGNERD